MVSFGLGQTSRTTQVSSPVLSNDAFRPFDAETPRPGAAPGGSRASPKSDNPCLQMCQSKASSQKPRLHGLFEAVQSDLVCSEKRKGPPFFQELGGSVCFSMVRCEHCAMVL